MNQKKRFDIRDMRKEIDEWKIETVQNFNILLAKVECLEAFINRFRSENEIDYSVMPLENNVNDDNCADLRAVGKKISDGKYLVDCTHCLNKFGKKFTALLNINEFKQYCFYCDNTHDVKPDFKFIT